MAKLNFRTISKCVAGDRDAVFWDERIPGFGVRVYPSGSNVYVVQTRHRGKSRRVTLGCHGMITADRRARRRPRPSTASRTAGTQRNGAW